MPKKKAVDGLNLVAEHIAEWEAISGSKWAGFRDWAVQLLLQDEDVSSPSDVADVTAVDKSYDFGIDGWYLSRRDGLPALYVIQVKDTQAEFDDLAKLREGFLDLFHVATGAQANDELRARVIEFSRGPIPEDLQVEFHVISSHVSPPSLEKHEKAHRSMRLLDREFQTRNYIHDVNDLREMVFTPTTTPIEWTFDIAKERCIEDTIGGLRTVTAALRAKDLVDAYVLHRRALFRDNPRYSLGVTTKINKKVVDTAVKTPSQFYLFNNGLTVLCASAEVIEPSDEAPGDIRRLKVSDLGIVNGCQTTVSLDEAAQQGAPLEQIGAGTHH